MKINTTDSPAIKLAKLIIERLAKLTIKCKIITPAQPSWNIDWQPATVAVIPEFGCEDLLSFKIDVYDLAPTETGAWWDWYSNGTIVIGNEPSVEQVASGEALWDCDKPLPAAACGQCGGWTSFGGMSQYYNSTVPVDGRIGCTCNKGPMYKIEGDHPILARQDHTVTIDRVHGIVGELAKAGYDIHIQSI